MSDCKGCKYWTQAIDDYANGKHTDEEPNPFCSTCEGDKYQQRGAKETKASLGAKIDAQAAEIERLKAKVAELEQENNRIKAADCPYQCPLTQLEIGSFIQDLSAAEIYKHAEKIAAENQTLKAKNIRLREVLEFVRNFEGYNLDSESHKAIEQALRGEG